MSSKRTLFTMLSAAAVAAIGVALTGNALAGRFVPGSEAAFDPFAPVRQNAVPKSSVAVSPTPGATPGATLGVTVGGTGSTGLTGGPGNSVPTEATNADDGRGGKSFLSEPIRIPVRMPPRSPFRL